MAVGIVLGAGGLVGPTYHLAVLKQLRDAGQIDPDGAAVLFGTSGGSIVASLLASGFLLDDLLDAFAVVDPRQHARGHGEHRRDLAAAVRHLHTLPALEWGAFQRPRKARRHELPEFRQRLAVRVGSLFSEGAVDPRDFARPFASLLTGGWPSRLRICAVRIDTGQRVVFGPNHPVDLIDACAASCAVPGMFTPVSIDGVQYSDGGFFSPTNADALLNDPAAGEIDEVVIVSPMSSPVTTVPVSRDHPIRVALHEHIRAERRKLRQRGIRVTVIEPDRGVRRAIAADYLDARRLPGVVEASLSGTRHSLSTPL